MKFISKSSNLMIVLRPGMSAQPLTGTPAVPTLSVRFKDGVAEVEQPELIKMTLAHPGFNSDFIASDNVAVDPYANSRVASEPAHEVTELKFGTPISHEVKLGEAPKLSPEIQKLVQSAAIELAKTMLPTMVEETLKKIVSNNKESNNTAPRAMKKRPGRKSGYKKPQVVAEKVIAEAPVVAEKVEVVTEVM
jgi:hypothetical protein